MFEIIAIGFLFLIAVGRRSWLHALLCKIVPYDILKSKEYLMPKDAINSKAEILEHFRTWADFYREEIAEIGGIAPFGSLMCAFSHVIVRSGFDVNEQLPKIVSTIVQDRYYDNPDRWTDYNEEESRQFLESRRKYQRDNGFLLGMLEWLRDATADGPQPDYFPDPD